MAVDYRKEARRAAQRHGLDPAIFERQINAESGFAPDVIHGRRRSSAGAQGIAQIMPATARGWKVNPLDPKAALNAAAKNMAAYVRRYGSYENALRAYNAGPAAIERSKGFSETNNYVAKILRGRDPKRVSAPTREPTREQQPDARLGKLDRGTEPTGTPGKVTQDISGALVDSLLAGKRGRRNGSLLREAMTRLQSGSYDTVTPARIVDGKPASYTPAKNQSTPRRRSPRGAPNTGGKNGRSSDIYEVFHDPVGGWDNGKWGGAIGGHGGHVHTAAEPGRQKFLQGVARKRFNLQITSTTGGKHAAGSFHYSDKAFDAAGKPEDMRAFVGYLRQKYNLK